MSSKFTTTPATSTPPGVLYHYTTYSGIIGIVENHELWDSEIRYLNDATEFSYAHDMLAETLRSVANSHPADVAATVEVLLIDLSFASRRKSVSFIGTSGSTFVSSFSHEGDQLSQWRGYCRDGGYALGFRTSALLTLAQEQGFDLMQCSYNEEAHRRDCEVIASELIERILAVPEEVRASIRGTPLQISIEALKHLSSIRNRMVDEIQRHAPAWKHKSFHEESEWRLVSKWSNREKVKFRAGRVAVIPYRPIKLNSDSVKVMGELAMLNDITVGPCPEPELAVSSAIHLLIEHGFSIPTFSLSQTPFRSW